MSCGEFRHAQLFLFTSVVSYGWVVSVMVERAFTWEMDGSKWGHETQAERDAEENSTKAFPSEIMLGGATSKGT